MSGNILRLVLGVTLLTSGWMTAFLMTIYVLPRDITLSLVSYAVSMIGLLVTVYEITSLALGRMRKRG